VENAPMGLISWILMGLIAGLLGRFLLPGRDPKGCIVTTLLGGFLATKLGYGGLSGFDLRSLGIATLGAIVLLLLLRLLRRG
jgi:uncharacterized membrane protein YeaQ/YmgE (transglycosylase-associated protein family)